MKKAFALLLCMLMLCSVFAGCSTTEPAAPSTPAADNKEEVKTETEAAPAAAGSVYYLNFKPEQDAQWQELAALYTEKTGVPVTVLTAASGTYETQLKSEMAKTEAPTLFQVNGPVGLAAWKDYCYDLSGSALNSHLVNPAFSLKNGEEVAAIAYVLETYGIIYNKAILADYCALDGAKIKDASEINNFETFKAVVEDMQARKAELGIEGAFTSAGMDSSSDWRFKTHLANLPIYYEYTADGIESTAAIKGSYLDNYKMIWDLYINNATCSPALLSAKTGDDALAEFVDGLACFYQNGTWAYNDVKELGDENIGMMPIYIGVEGEENQGLCTGSENYWCVNKNASAEDIEATLAFLEWVITSDEGRQSLAFDMGFVCPFDTFDASYTADNQFIRDSNAYIADGKNAVTWCFTTMPSEAWKNGVGSALTAYAAGTGTWDGVVDAFVNGWASEYAAANQ